jgi:hypothetical protein
MQTYSSDRDLFAKLQRIRAVAEMFDGPPKREAFFFPPPSDEDAFETPDTISRAVRELADVMRRHIAEYHPTA